MTKAQRRAKLVRELRAEARAQRLAHDRSNSKTQGFRLRAKARTS